MDALVSYVEDNNLEFVNVKCRVLLSTNSNHRICKAIVSCGQLSTVSIHSILNVAIDNAAIELLARLRGNNN